MRKDARIGCQDSVSATQVQERAGGLLAAALELQPHGYKCSVSTILLVLFLAAARVSSIHDACARLERAPTGQAVFDALADWLPSMRELEERLNRALARQLPKGLFKKSRPLAVDYTEIPYYGRPYRAQRELRRGKRKAGTSYFHCYATLYLLRRGYRYTVAVTYVWKDDTPVDVLERLLARARALGLKTRYLLLDRAFYSVPVVQHLQAIGCPFLLPVVHRGRRPRPGSQRVKGTRRFLARKRSGWATHVMANRQSQAQVRIAVTFRRRKSKRARGGRGGRRRSRGRPLVFAFWGFGPPSPAWCRDTYRSRFGIESSYRQMNQGRIRTCARDPRLRLLLVGIALVLRNVWVWLHHAVLGRICGLGVHLRLERLRLRTMLLMLQRCAEQALGCREQLPPLTALGP
jgi:hypothetical protein